MCGRRVFPDEIPASQSKPPSVSEWRDAPTVKLQPPGCFRKVVREWLKLNCSKSADNDPGPVEFGGLAQIGENFHWLKPGSVADVIVRMVRGRRGVATLQLESETLTIGYDWTANGSYPDLIWK